MNTDLLSDPVARERSEQPAQWMRGVKLVRSIRRQHEHWVRWRSMREMMQKLERRLISPVNVLEHEEHRLFGGESLENCEDQLEWTLTLTVGGSFRRLAGIGLELRKDRRQH